MSDLVFTLADAGRIAMLTLAAPLIGSVLLLAVARLTGARWQGIDAAVPLLPLLAVAGVAIGLIQPAHAPPAHLRVWMAWWAVALRGGVAGALLAVAGRRLAAGGSVNVAAGALTGFALLVTPVAGDWMLGQAPGHPVSAIGMMFAVEAIGGAAALLLASGRGSVATRRDLAGLTVAAGLGLGYLAYMDYLIVWFGNLPARVGFYVVRGGPGMAALAGAALLAGVAGPIALPALIGGEHGRRAAGGAALAGLLLFNAWWVAGGAAAVLTGILLCLLLGAGGWMLLRREAAHG